MKGKLIGFALALLSVATIGVVQLQTKAYVDTTRDCDNFAVVKCGTMSPQEARNKYNKGAKIFHAMGISKGEISGNLKHGVVYKDGRVVVNGKVVARNARTAIRNMSGGNKIAGTNAAIHSTSRMGSAQTAMVKFDKDGRFVFAIMKPCGNPVKANPTKPPKPQPKPSAVCVDLNKNKISRTKYAFTAKSNAKNGAKINAYVFTVTKNGNQVDSKRVNTGKESARFTTTQTAPGTYTVRVVVKTSVGSKTNQNCVQTFTVPKEYEKPAAVCEDLSVEQISRTQYRLTAQASTENGATINGYTFTVSKDGSQVANETVTTSANSAEYEFSSQTAGTYNAVVVVDTSVGDRNGPQCKASFTIPPKEEKPRAVCKDLSVETITQDEEYRFNATAETANGATISSYDFTVLRDNTEVANETVTTTDETASLDYTVDAPGNYLVKVVVNTSVGERNGPQCEATFTVTPPEENPGVKIEKYVENVKYTRVGIDVAYDYQIKVTNTGDVDLENVVITDTPEQGITLVSASQGSVDSASNTWTYTIPALAVGESMDFVLSAKVPVEVAGRLTNTVCVDAPEVPGNPDDCDEADVDVTKVPVCNPETGEIIRVDEEDADKYVPVDSPLCKEIEVCVIETKEVKVIRKSDFDSAVHTTDFSKCEEAPVVVETPPELPKTGAGEVILQLVGATSLAGAGAYYLASRRVRS